MLVSNLCLYVVLMEDICSLIHGMHCAVRFQTDNK